MDVQCGQICLCITKYFITHISDHIIQLTNEAVCYNWITTMGLVSTSIDASIYDKLRGAYPNTTDARMHVLSIK